MKRLEVVMKKHISRTKQGKGFRYHIDNAKVDKATVERIARLAIPPAWTDVEIAVSEKTKVQVTGYDQKGRKQYIYSKSHTKKQEAAKFDRITQFAAQLPTLRKRVEKDLRRRRFDKVKVVAAAVSLMDEEYFRVGNQAYARANKTFGLTTLRSKHITIKKGAVIFDFVGKSGQSHHKVVKDSTLTAIIAKLDTMPGYELFRYYDKEGALHNVTSSDVNEYIKSVMGSDYSAKDFRTWGGTMLAAVELSRELRPGTKAERKTAMTACIKKVASKLGNTPAVARSSYIDPRILTTYDSSDGIKEVFDTVAKMRPRKYISKDEMLVMELLKDGSR